MTDPSTEVSSDPPGPDAHTALTPDAATNSADPLSDPDYRQVVTELLGVLACGELMAFERLAFDASMAPTIADKAELAAMAVDEFGHFVRLRDRLKALGVDATEAMTPFVEALTEFHARTAPNDWYEGLIKAYVGNSLAADFYRQLAGHLDEGTRDLILDVLTDPGRADFVIDRIREAIAADPPLGGRLALWGRRLVGEALSQAQRVAAERDALVTLIVGGGGRPGIDLAEIGRMFAHITEAHTQRMEALGLSA